MVIYVPNKGRVPKLRFPEFSGEWEEKYLSDLMNFKNGLNASKDDYGSGYKFINVLDIINNDFIKHDSIIGSVNVKEADFQKNIVEYGDILFQRSSETREEVGQANVYLDEERPATFGGFVIRGKKKADYNPTFLNYLLKTASARKEITSKSGGSTRYNVRQETLSSVKITTSIVEEQNKIASLLSKIEARISTQNKIIVHQESLMKGLMQQIFTQYLRFTDTNGKAYPNWELIMLGDIGKTYNGLTGKTKDDFGEGKPYIQYVQIFNNSKIDTNKFGMVSVQENENQNQVQYGDIFFTTSSETPNEIGTSSVLIDNITEGYLNSFCFGFRPNSLDELVPKFAQFFFRCNLVRKEIVKLAQGSTRFNMSKVELMKLKFYVPHKEEQIKIASFLSLLNEKLEKEKLILEQYKQQKKFLLQNLFV